MAGNWDRRAVFENPDTRQLTYAEQDGTLWYRTGSESTWDFNYVAFTPEEIEEKSFKPMIEPFIPKQVRERSVRLSALDGYMEKVISYGLSSYGYDVRLGRKFKIFTNVNSSTIDPLNMPDSCYVDFEGDVCVIPPNSYILGHTVETFNMPRDVTALCVGKSTYARAGCAINVTPIEAGFNGQVVLEIANLTPLPMKVYADMGIAQFVFFQGEACLVSYGDRNGKYQGQTGITTARV